MNRLNLIFISILTLVFSCVKVEKPLYLKYSKFIEPDKQNGGYRGGAVTIRHVWSNKDFTASKGKLTRSKDRLTLKFDEFFLNEFDLYNKDILGGDTLNIFWDFILGDENFVKVSFAIYLDSMLSSKDLRVVTLKNFGLLRLQDNYHMVLNLDNDPIGEFVSIEGPNKTLVIHKEGVTPPILGDTSKFSFKRLL